MPTLSSPAPARPCAAARPGQQATRHKRSSNVDVDLRDFRYNPTPGKLTPTRYLVAQMVCCGLADKEIGCLLGITCQTVKFHVSQTMRTFSLQRRTQLVRFMFETGQFDPHGATDVLKLHLADKSRKAANFSGLQARSMSPCL